MPRIRKEVVVGIRETCVLDEVLEITVGSSSPCLQYRSLAVLLVRKKDSTHDITTNEQSCRRIDALSC